MEVFHFCDGCGYKRKEEVKNKNDKVKVEEQHA